MTDARSSLPGVDITKIIDAARKLANRTLDYVGDVDDPKLECDQEMRAFANEVLALLPPELEQDIGETDDLCEGCPPVGYPTDKTRCLPCPRRSAVRGLSEREGL